MTATITGCGSSYGTLFNRELITFARPQNEESVDFIKVGSTYLVVGGANDYRGMFGLLGGSVTGYYVSRDSDCPPEFEGGLPAVSDPLQTSDTLLGGGDPVIVADPARQAVFAADLRFDGSTTGIGVFRTYQSRLLSTTTCPSGTHSATQAASCWPIKKVINPLPGSFSAYFQDKPHLAVDERSTGTGAGNVYITATEFNFFTYFSRIWIVACTQTQFSHVSVRPDGKITITYINVVRGGSLPLYDIKYVSCNPATPPATPSCSPPRLVFRETRPLPFGGALAAQDFQIATYPKHAHRRNGSRIETLVVWDRCRVNLWGGAICPDADIRGRWTTDNGATWSGVVCIACFGQDQFFPWIAADPMKNVFRVGYYTSHFDPYQHRVWVYATDFPSGSRRPHLHRITTFPTDPAADPLLGGLFFGDYIGTAARGGVALFSFTYNNVQGRYNGIWAPQQNNHLSRFNY